MLMMIRSECLMFVVCELYGIEERNVKGIDEAKRYVTYICRLKPMTHKSYKLKTNSQAMILLHADQCNNGSRKD